MSRFALLIVSSSVLATLLLVAWWPTREANDLEPSSSFSSSLVAHSVSRNPVGAWSSANPFASLGCDRLKANGVETSACNPDKLPDMGSLGSALPIERSKAALMLIEAGEYDKISALASAFHDCSYADAMNTACIFSQVEDVVQKAEVVLLAAAKGGDYIARVAFVELLVTKVAVAEHQMQSIDSTKTDPESVERIRNARKEIEAIRGRLVAFVRSLSDPSDSLKDALNTNLALLE